MAGTLRSTDSIESSGYPLAFKVAQGTARTPLLGMTEAEDTLKVEVRAMGGHQKEAVVTEGSAGSAWRLVCDEGAGLHGTDLAPFPLAFMNAGLLAEMQGRMLRMARAEGIFIDSICAELVNRYAFAGSFFRGTGRGSAMAPAFVIRVASSAQAQAVKSLLHRTVAASPLLAAVRSALNNTFALYVNGQRREPLQVRRSNRADAPDPLKAWKGAPQPLAGRSGLADVVTKLAPPPPSTGPGRAPMQPDEEVRFSIEIRGESTCDEGITASQSWAAAPPGSRFGLKSDEAASARAIDATGDSDAAPCGLALAASGVAFCLMTQLLRYTEFRKYKIRAMRMVQYWPMRIDADPDGTMQGKSGNLDTHVFLHGEASDEDMGQLLLSSANTCYLHALLGAALESQWVLELNGKVVRE
ncbi:MAG: hypothetical protein EXR27_18855 [Betaproteobacteria bacterium]|nr:hypothetical protein [Betaproteobacteria bacterium]